MITIDVMIPLNSVVHGQFLVDYYQWYPQGRVESASHRHDMKWDHVALAFKLPDDVAVLLKLKYSNYIVTKDAIYKMEILKIRSSGIKHFTLDYGQFK